MHRSPRYAEGVALRRPTLQIRMLGIGNPPMLPLLQAVQPKMRASPFGSRLGYVE
jgi:hypothetical protein